MVERGEEVRFTLEADHPVAVGGKGGGKDLDRDFAAKPRIPRAVYLAHPARAERREDFIRPEANTGAESHRLA